MYAAQVARVSVWGQTCGDISTINAGEADVKEKGVLYLP